MARTDLARPVKDMAGRALSIPRTTAGTVAGTVAGIAKGAVRMAASTVAGSTRAVARRAQSSSDLTSACVPADTQADQEQRPEVHISPDEPVNVTEALGLDPAPVARPRRQGRQRPAPPATGIDAAADASQVDATPADVARAVEKSPDEQA